MKKQETQTAPQQPLLLLPADLAQGLATYLQRCPWAEVNALMQGLLSLQPAQQPQPRPAEPEAQTDAAAA